MKYHFLKDWLCICIFSHCICLKGWLCYCNYLCLLQTLKTCNVSFHVMRKLVLAWCGFMTDQWLILEPTIIRKIQNGFAFYHFSLSNRYYRTFNNHLKLYCTTIGLRLSQPAAFLLFSFHFFSQFMAFVARVAKTYLAFLLRAEKIVKSGEAQRRWLQILVSSLTHPDWLDKISETTASKCKLEDIDFVGWFALIWNKFKLYTKV